jgi:hypothetical protein
MADLELKKDIANDNFKEFYTPYKQHRLSWFRDANKFDNFRYNQHFTDTEVNELLKFRQAPIPIGMTAAICDTAEAMFTASDPTPRVIPVPYPEDDERHKIAKAVAYRYDAALKQTWRDSFGSLQFDKVIRDYNNTGLGFHYLVPRMEFGQFSVDYKHLPWYHVYVDYTSKDILFRDADAILVSFVMSLKQAWKLARTVQPDLSFDDFKKDWWSSNFIDVPTDYYQTRYSQHTYIPQEVMRFITRMTMEQQNVHLIVPRDKNSGIENHVVMTLTDEIKQLYNDEKIWIVDKKGDYLTEYTSLGSYGWKKTYPVKHYNVIPAIYDHRESPFPFGRVWYIYPIQRALNKFIALSILNASLSNSLKFFAEQGSILDIEKVQDYGSIPGVFIQWRRTTADAKPPQAVAPVPLSDAFLQFPKFLIYIMEYVSGISSVMSGDSKNSPDVFSTVAALQSAGGLKITRRLRNLQASMSQLGKVVAEFYKEYAPPDGQIVNVEKSKVSSIAYNTLQVKDGKPGYVPETDLSVGFHNVEFVIEASKGFQAATEAAMLTNLATQLKVQELVPLILDRLNIADADKVVESIKQRTDMVAKMQQQEQALEKLQKDNEGMQKQIMTQIKDLVYSDAKGKAGRVLERFRKDLEAAGVDIGVLQQQVELALQGNDQGDQQNA